MSFIYRFVRAIIRLTLRFYYADIEMHGLENIPPSGPLVMMANHHNGMVDPLFIIAVAPRPVRYIAKAPLFKIPILGFFMRGIGCIPAHRAQDAGNVKQSNEGLYLAVKDALVSGGAIGIFPEGKSHPDTSLAEFKHGAAKMALEAESLTGFSLGLKVQLVAIHFEKTRLFRGKVLVTFGPPMTLDVYREAYQTDPRAAVDSMTQALHEKMSQMILDADSDEVAKLAAIVEKMDLIEPREEGLRGKFKRQKLIVEQYKKLQESHGEKVETLRRMLRSYRQMLKIIGGTDERIAGEFSWGRTLLTALRRTIILVLGAPLLGAGLIINGLPYLFIRTCVIFSFNDQDARASVGVLVAIVVFPLWYGLLAWLGWNHLPLRAWVPILVAGPMLGMAATIWFERFRRLNRETWMTWLALWRPAALSRVKARREEIVVRVQELIEIYTSPGPSNVG